MYREEDILALKLLERGRIFYYYPGTKVIHRHEPFSWRERKKKEEFRHFLQSERYFFEKVLKAPRLAVILNGMARRFYYSFFHPMRSLMRIE